MKRGEDKRKEGKEEECENEGKVEGTCNKGKTSHVSFYSSSPILCLFVSTSHFLQFFPIFFLPLFPSSVFIFRFIICTSLLSFRWFFSEVSVNLVLPSHFLFFHLISFSCILSFLFYLFPLITVTDSFFIHSPLILLPIRSGLKIGNL